MGQRLGIASALVGDPRPAGLDEPVNGLDPEGVLWIRNLLKALAAEGHTVLVSSHLMSEMALTATRLIVVGRGPLIADTTVEEFVARVGQYAHANEHGTEGREVSGGLDHVTRSGDEDLSGPFRETAFRHWATGSGICLPSCRRPAAAGRDRPGPGQKTREFCSPTSPPATPMKAPATSS
jgi:ABC-type multidrug transport system ATPase subunit